MTSKSMEENQKIPDRKPGNVNIVLVGMSGSGKSTLINMLANLFAGLKFEDERLFAIPCTQKIEIEVGRQTFSEVKHFGCNIGEFQVQGAHDAQTMTDAPGFFRFQDQVSGQQITLIETPGLGSTRGEAFDEQHLRTIVHAILCAGDVSLICLVHSATEARLKDSTRAALRRLQEVLDLESKGLFAVCLTNSPKNIAPNCISSLEELGLSTEITFRFENSCLMHPEDYRTLCPEKLGEVNEEVNDLVESGARCWAYNERTVKQLVGQAGALDPRDCKELVREEFLRRTFGHSLVALFKELCNEEENLQAATEEKGQLDSVIEAAETFRFDEKMVNLLEVFKRNFRATRKEKKQEGLSKEGYFVWVDVPYEREITDWRITNFFNYQSQKHLVQNETEKNLKLAKDTKLDLEEKIKRLEKNISDSKCIMNYLLRRLEKNTTGNALHASARIRGIDKEIKRLDSMGLSKIFMTVNRPFKLRFMAFMAEQKDTGDGRNPSSILHRFEEANAFDHINEDKPLMKELDRLWAEFRQRERDDLVHKRGCFEAASKASEEAGKLPLTQEQNTKLTTLLRQQMEPQDQRLEQNSRRFDAWSRSCIRSCK